MNWVALKMLVGDRVKYVALIVGIAFAALMVTQQAAIFTGYAKQVGAWIRETRQGDLWVIDPQVRYSEDFKRLQDTALQRVRGVAGVSWAVPMFKAWLPVRLDDGTQLNVRFVGIDDASMVGAPPGMPPETAALLRRDRAVLIDAAEAGTRLARKGDTGRAPELRVGDRFSVNDSEAIIVGTYSRRPDFFWEPVAYTTYSRALSWAPEERRQLTYVVVKAADGADLGELQREIRRATGLEALTNEQFEWRSTLWVLKETGILINFGITIALGFLIGVLVCALLLYMFVVENTRYFAALKAMGATNARVLGMVALQVAVAGLVGYGIGVGGTAAVGMSMGESGNSGLAYSLVWQIPVAGAAAILVCCLAAGLVSVARVMRLEPGIVFK